jgi:DNA mismatch repair protein MutL
MEPIMSRIQILPEILANKIAAGEVVERPASVVKELLENALDAQADQIRIDIENGGKALIGITDNGLGMQRDDALLALERYATSKVKDEKDLFAIQTLGFRGEALPSIAAVSKFVIETRDKASEVGTQIIVEGGKIKDVKEIGAPFGTLIKVQRLFFNTPARRKFLKTNNTEMGHITDIISSIALGRPQVRFQLLHNNKTVKNWLAVSDPIDRVLDVLGKDVQNHILSFKAEESDCTLTGWISDSQYTRSTSRGIYTYVNGRFVRDRVIQHALFAGYDRRLMKGRYPVAVLFLQVPYDQVDVNVHPTKHEVRFAQSNRVHTIIAQKVGQTLSKADQAKWGKQQHAGKIQEPISAYQVDSRRQSPRSSVQQPQMRFSLNTSQVLNPKPFPSFKPQLPMKEARDIDANVINTDNQEVLFSEHRFSDLTLIGQLHATYILCESKDALILIDQHAAHERILFERIKTKVNGQKPSSQQLLMPETFELGFREADTLNQMLSSLSAMGLEIESFSGHTFAIKAVPILLADVEIKPIVLEIVEKMVATGFAPGMEKALDECLIIMACHGAIRAHQSLSDIEIKALLKDLDQCEFSSNCPHGRPVWTRWDRRFLEKAFKRVLS